MPAPVTFLIAGSMSVDGETAGPAPFVCSERADKGSFTIPGPVLERAGVWSGSFNECSLTVAFRASRRISIPGVDFAELVIFNSAATKTIDPGTLRPPGH